MTLTSPYRALMMLCLCAGLILPRISGVLLDLVPGVSAVVICTGDQMVVLHLDAQGQPVQVAQSEPDTCLTTADPAVGLVTMGAAHIARFTMYLALPVQVFGLADLARIRLLPVKTGPPIGM